MPCPPGSRFMHDRGDDSIMDMVQLQGGGRLGHVVHHVTDNDSDVCACDCTIEFICMVT